MSETPRQNTDQRIELKYLLDASRSAEIKAWAREHLGVDCHCDANGGESYQLNTLYLDSAEFDLFHRSGVVGRAKHRIRRYGNEAILWLETKRKAKSVVRKNRTAVCEVELMSRLDPTASTTAENAEAWCGDWFLERVNQRNLKPAVNISYQRFARTAVLEDESLRLTIDSDMQATVVNGWQVAKTDDPPMKNRCPRAFGEAEILELKFHNRMPLLFKQLLQTFAIPASGFSKYRTAVSTLGLVPAQPLPREFVLDA